MIKKLVVGLIIAVIIIFIFLFNPLNISPISLPCPTGGCNGELCGFRESTYISACLYLPEFRCLKSCRARNFKCDWNILFKERCEQCIFDCQEEYKPQFESLEENIIELNLTGEERLKFIRSLQNQSDQCYQKCTE